MSITAGNPIGGVKQTEQTMVRGTVPPNTAGAIF